MRKAKLAKAHNTHGVLAALLTLLAMTAAICTLREKTFARRAKIGYNVGVYLRNFMPPPKKIVRNGKARFGTFFPVPPRLDIRGVIAPFAGLALPSPITNFRIRGRIVYMFSVGTLTGFVEIYDGKLFGLADIILWNRENGKKYFFHTFMTARLRFIPTDTARGVFSSYKKSRYVRISWNRKENRITLVFRMKGDAVYPDISGFVRSAFDSPKFSEFLAVTPAPVTSRCSASWIFSAGGRGVVSVGGKKKSAPFRVADGEALSCFALNRMFYKFHTRAKAACGIGTAGGRGVIFRLVNTSVDAVDAASYNDNFLSVGGQTTLMPPVIITHPFGTEKRWVIQDTESMVDLAFTPVSVSKRSLHVIFFNTTYNWVYGLFDGVLLTGSGEKIELKGFPGIAVSNMIRL